MSRVVTRRIWVNPSSSTDVTAYNWYAGAVGDGTFLGAADAGTITPFAVTPGPEAFLDDTSGLPEGTYQFAVVAEDNAGNTSDPYQNAAWVSVPLDLTPPAAPVSGGID